MNLVRKSIVAGAVGLAAIGLAVVGPDAPAAVSVRLTSTGIPVPREPAPPSLPPSARELPTAGRVLGILENLVDPAISDQKKKDLVQGGVNSDERRAFRRDRLVKAASHGELPLSFTVGNIWWVGPNTAAVQVGVSGPKLSAPVSEVVTLVDENGWMLSSDSAATLIQAVTES